MAAALFAEFLRRFRETYPDANVEHLLPDMVVQDIINIDESAIITRKPTSADQALCLFRTILPVKGEILHRRFVIVLRAHNMQGIADDLQAKLDALYSHGGQVLRAPPVPPPSVPTGQDRYQAASAASPDLLTHSNELYRREVKFIDDIPDTAGKLAIRVQAAIRPGDYEDNAYYNTGHGRGLALLINNHEFDDHRLDRAGSNVDASNMGLLLGQLGYDVVTKTDRKASQMLDDVRTFSDAFENEPSYHSCVVALLTHGDLGKFMGKDGGLVKQDDLFKPITEKKALAGKPKIFIIQGCRGSKLHLSVDATDAPEDARSAIAQAAVQSQQSVRLPAGADVCIFHSTTPGYFSWRNTERGSWFIQAICEEFSANAHRPWGDLMTLATRVINKVGTKFGKHRTVSTADGGRMYQFCVQLPTIEMNMTKKFHFMPNVSA